MYGKYIMIFITLPPLVYFIKEENKFVEEFPSNPPGLVSVY
jgi:hypothetical protein